MTITREQLELAATNKVLDASRALKEAEGQETYAYKSVRKLSGTEGLVPGRMYRAGFHNEAHDYFPLYTALGEKP